MSEPINPFLTTRRLRDDEIDARLDERSARNEAHLEALRAGLLHQRSQRRTSDQEDDLFFVPGRGYVSRRELDADAVLRYADAVAPSEGHSPISETGLYSPALGMVEGAYARALSPAEGLLAGLSSDTEESQGFLPELKKGLTGMFDPEHGVDEATRNRLYRRRGGDRMTEAEQFFIQSMVNPINYAIPGWAAVQMRGMPRSAAAGAPAFLETAAGDPIMRLRNADLLPRRGLPAP